MDVDQFDDDDLETQKDRIIKELRRRNRANKKAQEEEEDRALIAAAEGKPEVSYDIQKIDDHLTATGPRKAKVKAKKDASKSPITWTIVKI
jgi:hypothetical protein